MEGVLKLRRNSLVAAIESNGIDISGNEIKGWFRAIKTTCILSGDVNIV